MTEPTILLVSPIGAQGVPGTLSPEGVAASEAAIQAAADAQAVADAFGGVENLETIADQTAADRVQTGLDRTAAQVAKTEAETARDAATVNAAVYASTTAAQADTGLANGAQYQVVSGSEVIRYRKDSSSASTELVRYPASAAVFRPAWTGLLTAWLDPFFRRYTPDLTTQNGRRRYHISSGSLTSFEVRQNVSPFNGGALVKTAVGTGNLGGPRIYLDDIGAVAGDTVTIRALVIATVGSPVVFFPARPLNAAGASIGTQINANPSSITATGSPQLMTVEVPTVALTESIFVYPYTNTASTEFAIVAMWATKGAAATAPTWPPLYEWGWLRTQVQELTSRVAATEGGYRQAWVDPLFRHFEVSTASQLGRARYIATLTDLSLVANTVRDGRALRVDGNATNLAGPRIWLDELNATAGQTVTLAAEVIGSGATARLAWRPIDASGNVIGTQVQSATAVTSSTPQLLTASGVLPAGAAGIRVYPFRSAGTGTFDVTALWGNVGATVPTTPPSGDEAWTWLATPNLETRVTALESVPSANSGRVNAVYGAQALRSLAAKRALLAGGASTTLKVGLFGDSWTATTYRWYDPIKARFNTELGVAAPGFIAANTEIPVPTGATRTRTGTWTDERTTGVLGPDTSHTSTTDTTATLTIGGSGVTSFRVHWVAQTGGGSFAAGLVGGSATTVSTAGAQAHGVTTIAGNGSASLQITIPTAGSGVILLGVEALSTASPVTVHKLGSGGSTAARFVSIPAAVFQGAVQALELDVAVIMLGTNDMSGNVLPATFRADIETIVSRIRTAVPLCDILLVAPGDNGLTGRTYTMAQYADVLFDAAVAGGHAMLDLRQVMGTYAEANSRGLYEDNVHPDADGGRVMANHLWRYLMGAA